MVIYFCTQLTLVTKLTKQRNLDSRYEKRHELSFLLGNKRLAPAQNFTVGTPKKVPTFLT